jgi:hypothetical protein
MICNGFSDSKSRNKHFKKHVLGKGGGTAWIADMPGRYLSAVDYERAAIEFATREGAFHASTNPIVELETANGNFARWNQNTGEFVAATAGGDLLTYHIRDDASKFQSAILEF